MKHHVESIGAQFGTRDLEKLAKLLDERAAQGYDLHTVFMVQQPSGCLGIGGPVNTYLAVFRKEE